MEQRNFFFFSFLFFGLHFVFFSSRSEPCLFPFSELLPHYVHVSTRSTSLIGFILGFLTTAICTYFSSFPSITFRIMLELQGRKCLFKCDQKKPSVIRKDSRTLRKDLDLLGLFYPLGYGCVLTEPKEII